MRAICVILLCSFVFSCQPKPGEQLEHLNGYWEIVEVKTLNGESKSYAYNTTIDYIYVKDNVGFRKKMQPGINNAYKTSDDAEALNVRIENDSLNLYYSTPLDEWKETVIKLNEEELEIVNKDQITYVYRRYTPVDLNLE